MTYGAVIPSERRRGCGASRGICIWVSAQNRNLLIPSFAEIEPRRILALDQRQFFLTQPSFDLLFSADCVADVAVALQIDQTVDVVAVRKSRNPMVLVLPDPLFEFAGYAAVKGARAACHDVEVIAALRIGHKCRSLDSRSVAKLPRTSLGMTIFAHDYKRASNPRRLKSLPSNACHPLEFRIVVSIGAAWLLGPESGSPTAGAPVPWTAISCSR